jgi:hypothetical protein
MNGEGTVVDQENIYDLGADGTDRSQTIRCVELVTDVFQLKNTLG